MTNRGILLAAMVEKIYTLKDKSVKLVLETQELSPNKAGALFQLMNQIVSVYVKPNEINEDEINKVDQVEPQLPGKTPSQRMRNVLFILWKQDHEGYQEFDYYYKSRMDKFIEGLKNNIIP